MKVEFRPEFFRPQSKGRKHDFYVYEHRDSFSNTFYVGKGRKRRAWEDHGKLHMWYVNNKLSGTFQVVIVRDGLSELEALELENDLMKKYGEQLINWINPYRDWRGDEVWRREKFGEYEGEWKTKIKQHDQERLEYYRNLLNKTRSERVKKGALEKITYFENKLKRN